MLNVPAEAGTVSPGVVNSTAVWLVIAGAGTATDSGMAPWVAVTAKWLTMFDAKGTGTE